MDVLLDVLGARPATWLRPFLSLALQPTVPSENPHWFRLSPPVFSSKEHVRYVLTWFPHDRDEVFTRFRGELSLLSRAPGLTMLELVGSSVGGSPDRDDAVVAALFGLIASALGAVDSTQ